MSELVIERAALPKQMLEWIKTESEGQTSGLLFFRFEDGILIFQKVNPVDPATMTRVRAAAERFRPALERLADA